MQKWNRQYFQRIALVGGCWDCCLMIDLRWSFQADSANAKICNEEAHIVQTLCIIEIDIKQNSIDASVYGLCESHWQWYGNDACNTNTLTRVHIVVRRFIFFIFLVTFYGRHTACSWQIFWRSNFKIGFACKARKKGSCYFVIAMRVSERKGQKPIARWFIKINIVSLNFGFDFFSLLHANALCVWCWMI